MVAPYVHFKRPYSVFVAALSDIAHGSLMSNEFGIPFRHFPVHRTPEAAHGTEQKPQGPNSSSKSSHYLCSHRANAEKARASGKAKEHQPEKQQPDAMKRSATSVACHIDTSTQPERLSKTPPP